MTDFNPIQTGWGAESRLWAFITFLISKLKPPNLVTFPYVYLETIWYSKSLSVKFYVTMQPLFDKRFFQSFEFFSV